MVLKEKHRLLASSLVAGGIIFSLSSPSVLANHGGSPWDLLDTLEQKVAKLKKKVRKINVALGNMQVQIDDLIQGGTGGSSATLVDSLDTEVAPIMGTGLTGSGHQTGATVALEIQGRIVAVSAQQNGFRGNGSLYFATSDCTGTAYVPSSNGVFADVAVQSPGNTLYIADQGIQPGPVDVGSFIANPHSGVSNAGTCLTTNFTITGLPATASIDLNTLYTPPFRVEM
ncbi:MAG: hypothetical protein AAF542_24690 [Pseudomonadota bacterium]